MKANELPRKAGTRPFAKKWKRRVPNPAKSSVALTERPVSMGTKIVAPNIANMCWNPNTTILGTPSLRAS